MPFSHEMLSSARIGLMDNDWACQIRIGIVFKRDKSGNLQVKHTISVE